MRTRITVTDLRHAVALLNRITKNTPGTVGSYVLDGAYGGWELQRLANDSGAVSQITYGYLPARELLAQIHAFRRGYELAELASIPPAADCCPVTGDTYGIPA
jgi:hypothetical protein